MRLSADLKAFEGRIGHKFSRPELLLRAVTHASISSPGREDNQRLEFLGDRVLGLVMAEALLTADGAASEGQLAPRFNALVRKEACAEVAREVGLGEVMKLGRSEMLSGGRRKEALLGDAMEALIAAVYTDGGFEAARSLIISGLRTALSGAGHRASTTVADATLAALAGEVAAYRQGYAAYYDRCKYDNSPPLRDPNAVVYLVPGVGMLTFAKDKATARISAEFYVNAINVMRGADTVSEYCGLPEQEAFDIEYWLLEEAKLQRMPKPKPLVGKVGLVTGGAGGIGQAIARRLLSEGACVVLADIDQSALDQVTAELTQLYGKDHVRGVSCDVTSQSSVIESLHRAAREFGGIDILVSNAGIASAAPLDETSLELWQRNLDILATGYFLVSREAFKQMKAQGTGGSIVMIASKNGMVASNQATAYCAAKAAEIQLSRSVALEGAPLGIRSNVVNPDAVIRGSKIWTGKWSEERAAANKIEEGDLEAFYRERSMLKRSVFPQDIAEAAYFFAADHLSGKSTGNILNVDAGNLAAFTR